MNNKLEKKIHLIAVDMGYGHQRAAYPLIPLSYNGIVTANNYEGIDLQEKKSWEGNKRGYEFISYFKKLPIVGDLVFSVMDYFQKIDNFYPKRDLSKPSFQQKFFYKKIKKGLGKKLIDKLNKNPLPLVTSFFVSAYFAEYYNYMGEIYCIVCDADISRAWAPLKPKESKIKYLVPNKRVKERLKLYGVKDDNIFISGFPLPSENIGNNKNILKKDLQERIINLDPTGVYRKKYKKLIEDYLGPVDYKAKIKRPLTITFAVGGAGAQRDLGVEILKSLQKEIEKNEMKLNLIAGSRLDVYSFFKKNVENLCPNTKSVKIVYNENKVEYFKEFNQVLRTTDILWTKPSELTFYSGLGIPIIMSEPIGSQEHYNREWLLAIGAGIDSEKVNFTDQWLFDWLRSGWLAEAAMQGFLDAPNTGTENIENIVLNNKVKEIDDIHLL